MKINVVRVDCTEFETPLLAVKVFQGEAELVGPVRKIDERLGGQISSVIGHGDFQAKEGQTLVLYSNGSLPAERVLLVGLGKREQLDLEKLRRAAATATRQAARLGVKRLASLMHHAELVADRIDPAEAGRAVAEGAVLAAYAFDELKSDDEDASRRKALADLTLLEKVDAKADALERGARLGEIVARAENLARTLGNLPGNVATPTYLGETAQRIADERGLRCTVLGPRELEEEGLNLLLTVSRGSDQEPRLIVLEHRGGADGDKPLVLLGKGLTFDAGGISIKPAQSMEDMKFDMGGGAAVLGAMQAIGELQLPVNVVGIVPSSENLLSGSANKPGDIIRSHSGKTVEIINTDAEGRLLLADGLSYARRFEPAAVVDAATLTGAVVLALGHHTTGLMSNDDALSEELRAAGERAGERAWPLPLYDEYREQLKSDYADLKNTGGRPAGSITAGLFLREFVGDFPWAHLDVAGTAYGEGKQPYQTKGATGVPTRLLVEWVRARAR